MKIIAKTHTGAEFCYSIRSAHKVPEKKAAAIADALTGANYHVNAAAGERWHVYDVDQYDSAYVVAAGQSFGFRRGALVRRSESPLENF